MAPCSISLFDIFLLEPDPLLLLDHHEELLPPNVVVSVVETQLSNGVLRSFLLRALRMDLRASLLRAMFRVKMNVP